MEYLGTRQGCFQSIHQEKPLGFVASLLVPTERTATMASESVIGKAMATSNKQIQKFDTVLLLTMGGGVVALSVTGCRSWRSHNLVLGQLSAIFLYRRNRKTTVEDIW